MKFNVICADPPWFFNDKLTMDSIKRGASSQYDVLNFKAIKSLPVERICAKDALLALWTPSSMLTDGLEIMEAWGFKHKQTFIWVKIKVNPLEDVIKAIKYNLPKYTKSILYRPATALKILSPIEKFDFNDSLSFGMGRLFRNTHEIALIGTRGKIYNKLKSKSERTVHFYKQLKHSEKPEGLQDKLDIMFEGSYCKKLELFGRRQRKGWVVVGNESGLTNNEDIRISLAKLSSSTIKDLAFLYNASNSEEKMFRLWQKLSYK